MMKDLGYVLQGEVWGDGSAALGVISRNGFGQTRHIDTSLPWVQEAAAQQRLKYAKVLGKENPADLCTKYLDAATMDHHTRRFQCNYCDGRADEAPKLHTLSRTTGEHINGGPYEECSWVKLFKFPRRSSNDSKQKIVNLSLLERPSSICGTVQRSQSRRTSSLTYTPVNIWGLPARRISFRAGRSIVKWKPEFPPARGQSEELYSICQQLEDELGISSRWRMQKLSESLSRHGAMWCRSDTDGKDWKAQRRRI